MRAQTLHHVFGTARKSAMFAMTAPACGDSFQMIPFRFFACLSLIVFGFAFGCGAAKLGPISQVKLAVSSPAFKDGGDFPVEFTGDGEGVSPPVSWKNPPKGTKSFALNLWHIPGQGDVKSYWVVYNIPATVTGLEKGSMDIGITGHNDKNRQEYDPMKSKGPGVKEYNITVYALSEEPKFGSKKVNRAELLKSIQKITLAEGTIRYKYERGKKME